MTEDRRKNHQLERLLCNIDMKSVRLKVGDVMDMTKWTF